jgi:hypothetical protein
MTKGGYLLWVRLPENLEMTAKTMTDAALDKTADELLSWLQCCHDQHSGTTSDPATT